VSDNSVLHEQPARFAIAPIPSPRRTITRSFAACSWVNVGSLKNAAILAQMGEIYFGAGGHHYVLGKLSNFSLDRRSQKVICCFNLWHIICFFRGNPILIRLPQRQDVRVAHTLCW
jgi:hypothetical protein